MNIPEQPTPAELTRLLAECSNDIAQKSMLVEQHKTEATLAERKYKRTLAAAIFKYSNEKNAAQTKARAELDSDVIAAEDQLDAANAIYRLAQAELEGLDAQFTALRKIAELRKTEMRTFVEG